MNKLIEIRTGSDSDISKIKATFDFLNEVEIAYSQRILSAHRTPEEMTFEAKKLEANKFKVCIAAAGGSAHLAGMTASETSVPVVALPVESSLGGLDSLLSMIQMPPGIANGCVGINDAKSAGILALRIAYLDNELIREKLSKKINTKIIGKLIKKPFVNIVTDNENLDTTLLDRFEIEYSINQKITSPIVIYITEISKFPQIVPKDIEQISIIALTKNKTFKLSDLEPIISGPYAFVGVERVNNSFIYAAQILGNYFPEVKEKFKRYKEELRIQVIEKDKKLQEKKYN